MSRPYRAKTIAGAQEKVRALQRECAELSRKVGQYYADRIALAKLAAEGPCFYNPLDAFAAKHIRDEVLRDCCKMKPDGTPL